MAEVKTEMRRIRRSDGSIAELTEAEFAAWLGIFHALNDAEPDFAKLAAISEQIDAVRATLGREPLRL